MGNNATIYTETNRLVLRSFCLEDVESFYIYRSNPDIARFQSWDNYQRNQAVTFINEQIESSPNIPGSWLQYAVALKTTNQLIGDCAVHTPIAESDIVEIGFTFASEYQGKGYATEAVKGLLGYLFEIFNKHKVIAYTNVENESSVRLLERVGMRREGHLLQNYKSKGKWVDEYLYAILQQEWVYSLEK
ncbi:GNAT family N-acetyltransferase [Paenibacillus wynnii]|uniref:Ribosomal-protein-serine acetyltransferase n=1 Tax=Paenibacillus wynnii TaxID=268407 RepID=A0A098M4Y9_9BACL|nr:GNAT family protein [Paenibacillus wynnii]KGE16612.1 ribosomal-protein-serine acetyltransferase [Paenibacillus wynnii]